jgi:hypothetical protein
MDDWRQGVPRNDRLEISDRLRGQDQASRFIIALGEDQDTGGDAYDTLNLATCVALRTNEKYHRRPACVPVENGCKSAIRSRGQDLASGFIHRPW